MPTPSTPDNPPEPGPAAQPEFLNPAESLQLLATRSLGRLILTESALPMAYPTWYTVDDIGVVIRTDETGKQLDNHVLALQADDIDLGTGAGWTVTIVGHAHPITDPTAHAKLRRVGIRTWTPSDGHHYFRITATLVAGHLLPPAST